MCCLGRTPPLKRIKWKVLCYKDFPLNLLRVKYFLFILNSSLRRS